MCGIFGIVSENKLQKKDLFTIARCAESRGKDSSGYFYSADDKNCISRNDGPITNVIKEVNLDAKVVIGHSRLITNGLSDNQPIFRDNLIAIHNGVLVNHENLWKKNSDLIRNQIVDTEIIPALIRKFLDLGNTFEASCQETLTNLKGVAACAVISLEHKKLALFSNNGSLYVGKKNGAIIFSSESYPLTLCGAYNIKKVQGNINVIDISVGDRKVDVKDNNKSRLNLIPKSQMHGVKEKELQFEIPNLKRCTKCILPETMPFIKFDRQGVCNYCENYSLRNEPQSLDILRGIVEPFKENPINGVDCIVPFSGGRDSSYALHFIVEELGMRPVTYTYDWGMVTDLARRNVSRMCADLGVENIIIAADIEKKRSNIKKNFQAWLKNPDLGMVSILTAGDKHFYKHVQTIKKQTGLSLDLWGVNPLEVTHFKAGFLGVPPYFQETKVYNNGFRKQIRYQVLRLNAMRKSLGYFNSSIWDTLSGEYYRSIAPKKDYHHVFDYWKWDEKQIDQTLSQYNWETAPDTSTTWRIGDGTAAMYNYIYYTMAGFTEHDTFRSNQIREGQLTRSEALSLVQDENRPRYMNIKWYLDAIGLPFEDVIKVINSSKKYYSYD